MQDFNSLLGSFTSLGFLIVLAIVRPIKLDIKLEAMPLYSKITSGDSASINLIMVTIRCGLGNIYASISLSKHSLVKKDLSSIILLIICGPAFTM
jgi:hypothetical protein